MLNFAAESHVDRSIDGPGAFVQTNIVGTFELLDAARAHWARLGRGRARRAFRFLHVSTDEVYGTLGDTGLFSEETPYAPNSPYAASKAAADHLVRAWHHTYGLPVVITNCSNNYGPYQFPEKLIPLMLLNALEGKSRCPSTATEATSATGCTSRTTAPASCWRSSAAALGEKYNIGGENERTNLEIVDLLCDRLEAHAPAASNAGAPARGSIPTATSRRSSATGPGHDRRYAIDASKIRRELGWTPEHDFRSGLDRTVAVVPRQSASGATRCRTGRTAANAWGPRRSRRLHALGVVKRSGLMRGRRPPSHVPGSGTPAFDTGRVAHATLHPD